jgi:hypothetical protein
MNRKGTGERCYIEEGDEWGLGTRWMWSLCEERSGPCRPSHAVSLAMIGGGAAARIEVGVGSGFLGCKARGETISNTAPSWMHI